MVSAQARLEQVRHAVKRGLSQRRACALMRTARSGLYYDLRMPVKDAPVIEAMCCGPLLALAASTIVASGFTWPVGKIRVKTCHILKTLCRQRRPSRHGVRFQVSRVLPKSLELASCIRTEEHQI